MLIGADESKDVSVLSGCHNAEAVQTLAPGELRKEETGLSA
jgi:hypothetical protein